MTILAAVLLGLLIVWAILHLNAKAKKGGGCCGDHEETVKKTAVKDRNRQHYPYRVTLCLGGMTCENCARRVENALNALPGVWASADISKKQAVVRMKEKLSEKELRGAVASAGYTVLEIRE
ncbi:MAG: heavy metal-associated domain-containing protein [Eubacteriales bacterium]|nr:heavy metal-associated domain-containing protein [Eubacteriales bacterium]